MIRTYKTADRNHVIELLELNTPKYFDPNEMADFNNYLDHEIEDYYVFEVLGEIIGAGGINYFPEEKLARISWDFVHPDKHGIGIGRALLEHRIERIQENPEMDTIVVRTSQFVYKFYEKSGFVLENIEKDYWAVGFDLYLMKYQVKPRD